MRWNRYRRDRQIIAAVLVFTAIVAAGIALQPGFHPPRARVTGDKQLVSMLTPLLNGARGQVAAALITPQGVRYGLWGSEYTTQYEVASLSKTMTASLLLEAIRRGEVTAQTPVSALIPEIVSPVRNVTLEQLVSHRSGLPPLTATVEQRLAILSAIARRQNPWRFDRPALIAMMNQATLQSAKWFDYSNAGFALLGLALERASRRDFATLMAQRVFAPAGMQSAEVARQNTPASPSFAAGWSVSGFPQQPWVMDAFAPAGGVRATIVDMAKYAQALLAGGLAGSDGMRPLFATDDPDSRVGYAWFTTRIRGREIVWHDGQSGGFAAMMAFDPQRRTAVVILSDTAWPVIGPAIRLLLAATADQPETPHERD
ncbi:serine hydrolase domain-containing protein [Klebsiella quasipneumoniae]|uniref:serine hydrolase domain-containing protein n=1 Tax=Klebsiella quasipneumoniae TaxID=1463165 RepID=UPI002B05F006|nr:serine hydrolase domain-containing protein [Klebsiella quasipneumoniae]